MSEELTPDVETAELTTATESSTEIEQPVAEETPQQTTEEPVDENGVPIKNRIAEANRKIEQAKRMTASQAQTALLDDPVDTYQGADENQAIQIVENIVDTRTRKALEPILVKDFLRDNPDAVDFVDDIIEVRRRYPELSDVTKLDVAYKVARAEKQEELLRQAEERGRQSKIEKIERQGQGAIEGAGKVSMPPASITDKIASANTEKELEELEQHLR